jgi:ribokinase
LDPAAEIALRAAANAGVDLRQVQRDALLATGLCLAAVSPGGQRTFFSFRGANVALDAAPLLAADMGGVLLHLCAHSLLEEPQRGAALLTADEALRRHTLLSLDLCTPAARNCRDLIFDLLPRLAILFMNEDELALLLPGQPPDEALRALIGRGARLVALKRGARGCIVMTRRGSLVLDAAQVQASDTNGCGDAFVAGFLWAYLRGATLAGCAALANLVGSLTATRPGAAEALPTLAELLAHLREQQGWAGVAAAHTVLDIGNGPPAPAARGSRAPVDA